MTRKTLHEWIDSHAGKYPAYRLRVGSGANPPTVAIVCTVESADKLSKRFKTATVELADDTDDLSGVIEEIATDHGYPNEAPTLRLHALGATSTEDGASFTEPRRRTETPTIEASTAASIEALCGSIVQAMRVNVKTIDILTETIAHREDTATHLMEQMLQARDDQNAAEADAMAASLILDIEQGGADPLKEAAARTLEAVAPLLLGVVPNGAGAPAVDVDTVIGLLEADPALAVSLAQDPRIVALIMSANAVQVQTPQPEAPQPVKTPPEPKKRRPRKPKA